MDEGPPEVMIVMGGYNSSNTDHLAHLCRKFTTTYHIEDAACIDPEDGTIRHKPDVGSATPEVVVTAWMPEGLSIWGCRPERRRPTTRSGRRWFGFWRFGAWSISSPDRQEVSGAGNEPPADQKRVITKRKPMNGRRTPGSTPPRIADRTFLSGSLNAPPRITHRASASRPSRSSVSS